MRRAKAAGLAAIALTDHDTTDGVAEAMRAGETLAIRVVPGCEFSVKAPWGELHVLGYFLPAGEPRLEDFLVGTRAARHRRAEQMVARLQRLGVEIALADVLREAGDGSVGRPHVARALVACGAAADINDAFARYLGRGRPAYVEKPLPLLRQVTDPVHGVGPLAPAAPLREHGSEGQIRPFPEQGLDGLEVRHPSHSPAVEQRLTRIAQRLGLAISGGGGRPGGTQLGGAHATLGGPGRAPGWVGQARKRRPQAPRGSVSEKPE